MGRYLTMVTALKAAGIDCPAARYVAFGMIESGKSFAVVKQEFSVYMRLPADVIDREFAALCWPSPAAARLGEVVMEVLEHENRILTREGG